MWPPGEIRDLATQMNLLVASHQHYLITTCAEMPAALRVHQCFDEQHFTATYGRKSDLEWCLYRTAGFHGPAPQETSASRQVFMLCHDKANLLRVADSINAELQYGAWAELVLIQLVTPNASFLGHLAGILAGLLYVAVRGAPPALPDIEPHGGAHAGPGQDPFSDPLAGGGRCAHGLHCCIIARTTPAVLWQALC